MPVAEKHLSLDHTSTIKIVGLCLCTNEKNRVSLIRVKMTVNKNIYNSKNNQKFYI